MLLPLPPPNYSHHSHIIANRNYLPPAIHASSPPHQQQQQQQQHPRHHHTYAVSSWSPEGRRLTDDNNNNTMPPAISPPPSRKLLQPSTSNDGTKEQAAVDLTVTPRASAQTSLPHPPRQPIHLVVPTATATGCKCRSSFCLKKNCECFQNATPCDPAICQCVSCQNGILDPSAVASPPPSSRSPSVQQHPKIPSTTNSAANGAARGILAPLHPFNAASYDTRPQPECSSSIARSTAHVQQHEDVGEIEILAAMAMTQLLHGLSSSKEPSNDTKESSFSSSPSITKVDPTSQPHGSAERKRRIPSITPSDECNQRSHDRKRFNRSTPDSDVMLTEDDDEIVHHSVSSSTSFVSVESRDPSPQAAHRPYSYIMRYPPHPPPQHQYHGPMRASPPPHPGFAPFPMAAYGHPRRFSNDFRGYPTATLMQCPPLPPPRMSPPSMFRALPTRQAFVSPPSKQILPTQLHKTLQPCQSSDKIKVTNEESPQSRCLPKSLSFRKICSRCGKTRGEHGEMGYGNKCIYSDCGKCGASLHCHEQAGQQMGVSCQLTVAQGATPGASAAYDRKIRSLAFRADIQQALHRRKTIPSV